jgi:hypothetical protein
MAIRMQQRRGTAEQWDLANPVLAAGEIGFETDTSQFKIGDGVTTWENLSYFANLLGVEENLEGYVSADVLGEPLGVATLDESGQVPANQLGNATVDLSGYATEEYVNDSISNIPPTDLTGYATEEYVDTAIENVVGLAPEDLNTLSELADALGDNPAAITTLQSDVSDLQAGKADLVDGQVPANQLANATVDLSDYATTNSPTFTGLTDFEGIVDFSEAVVVGIEAGSSQSSVPHPFSMIG